MCGRFVQSSRPAQYARHFGIGDSTAFPEVEPHYNIAPSQPVLAIHHSELLGNRIALMRWGLIPSWAKDWNGRAILFNARAEGIENKPSFRGPLRHRRCIVPTEGFYEWRSAGRTRQPYFFHPRRGGCVALAGLWDLWEGPRGETIASCAIIVTEANERVRPVHGRMPVVLHSPESWALWLDPRIQHPDEVLPLLKPCAPDLLDVHPVSTRVNKAIYDDAGLIVPLESDGGLL